MSISKPYINIELEKLNYHNNMNNKNVSNNHIIKILVLLNILFIIVIIFILYIEKEKIINKIELIKENEICIYQHNMIYKKSLKFNLNELIKPMKILGKNKIRLGNKYDGGYILLDDFENIKIAYSLGISNDVSFDKELADKNIDIYMYDHTIEKLPYNNTRFHWKKIGLIGGTNIKKDNMESLDLIIMENGHSTEQNMILKIDIEYYEWQVFESLPINILNQFKYIVAEFHFRDSKDINYYSILKKIENTHQIFHIHCNNLGDIIDIKGYKICSSLEISYINKKGYQFVNDDSIYPINGLDYKNCDYKKDYSYILNILNEINP